MLCKTALVWLRLIQRKLPLGLILGIKQTTGFNMSAITESSCINALIFSQTIAVDVLNDVEYYAIYDPDVINTATNLVIFKPLEYLVEVTFSWILSKLQIKW
ncbi:hypothetical protein [Iningainema tapete]|uniref:Uncharacterized protein n=1 Tax=Iningainema tapete BLCC-T55 TaxID=2748662 RepID=A0A8J6XSH6_9CYAN|nr:hypothetical protein [Iningainema tapete]MBD2778391.1 hypothetical protein [Iningainema tapete BLCC-T55]